MVLYALIWPVLCGFGRHVGRRCSGYLFGGNLNYPGGVSRDAAPQLTALAMAGTKACSDLTVVTRPWL